MGILSLQMRKPRVREVKGLEDTCLVSLTLCPHWKAQSKAVVWVHDYLKLKFGALFLSGPGSAAIP